MRLRRSASEPTSTNPDHAARPLATTAIYRNLQGTRHGVWAWYRLEQVPWSFRSAGQRASVLDAQTLRWADLTGHRVHIRRTGHPFSHEVWARQLDRNTAGAITVPAGAPTWADYLTDAQKQIARLKMRRPVTYLGVRVTDQKVLPDHLRCLVDGCDRHEKKHTTLHGIYERVTASVAKDGFRATPVSSRVLARLIQGSVAMGSPESVDALAGDADTWTEDDLDAFTHSVHVATEPLAKTVQVTALRRGREHVGHVAVLAMGRMEDQDTDSPAFAPWLTASDDLDFPVEWSATFDVKPPKDTAGEAGYYRRRAESTRAGYEEHGETPPPAYDRSIRDAMRVEDEIREGSREVQVRLAGVIRAAVTAPTPELAVRRAENLTEHYARSVRAALHHTFGQYAMLREFIPGEPHARQGFQRVMPAYYAATAVPNAGAHLGDGEGPYLGAAGHQPVMFDPTWGPRNNLSGLIVVAGGLGSGKSSFAGSLAENSVRRGHRTIIFDPSGPLARLCQMPALAHVSRHVELSGAEPGTLNPFWLIPNPGRALFDRAEEHAAGLREAEAERRDLAVDALAMLLPDRTPASVRALERAVAEVGGGYGTNPWLIVRALEVGNEHAQEVAEQLRVAAHMKGARLIFPTDEDARVVSAHGVEDALLTVLTMRGITTAAPGTPTGQMSRAERMAVPVLHLAGRYAMRAMYADTLPKLILSDEAGIIAGSGSTMRATLTRGVRDSRKTNTGFGILSQNPNDLIEIAPQVANLIGAAFVGRLEDEATASAALSLLGVPVGHGYEKELLRRDTPGSFLMRDWNGNVDRVDVDLSWRPDLLTALDTTPRQQTRDTDEAPNWTDELAMA